MFGDLGKLLILVGLVLIVSGLLLTFLPALRLGRLPGDVVIKRDSWSLYLPITTSLSISIVLSLMLWIFSFLRR